MQVTTFIIAVLGLAVAASSLTWNIVSFLLSAGRASVELRIGALLPGGQYMTLPVRSNWQTELRENLQHNGLTGELVIVVVVRNTGRSALTVQSCGFRTPTGVRLGNIGGPDFGKQFPLRIEAGGPSVELGYRAEQIVSAVADLAAVQTRIRD